MSEFEVGYRGHSEIEAGFYFAPYRPGMTDEEIAEVNARIAADRPTEFQRDIMRSITEQPMIRVYFRS